MVDLLSFDFSECEQSQEDQISLDNLPMGRLCALCDYSSAVINFFSYGFVIDLFHP